MTDVLTLFGLRLFAVDDERHAWRCLPIRPSIVTSPDGTPSVFLLDAPGMSSLALTAHLHLGDESLVEAREEIARRLAVAASLIDLKPAHVVEASAELLLEDAQGPVVLAGSGTSGVWPYQAALHATLSSRQVYEVRAALGGKGETLILRYTVRFSIVDEAATHVSLRSSSSMTTTTTTTTTTNRRVVTKTDAERVEQDAATASATVTAHHVELLQIDAADWLGAPPANPTSTATPSHS